MQGVYISLIVCVCAIVQLVVVVVVVAAVLRIIRSGGGNSSTRITSSSRTISRVSTLLISFCCSRRTSTKINKYHSLTHSLNHSLQKHIRVPPRTTNIKTR
jgi:hypothetical protein